MAIRSTGEMDPDAMNEMNVPVVCFIFAPEKEGDPWKWTARNFMPRKEYCGSSWDIEADTKKELSNLNSMMRGRRALSARCVERIFAVMD